VRAHEAVNRDEGSTSAGECVLSTNQCLGEAGPVDVTGDGVKLET
jgi:hypothetical protein